MLTEGKRTGEFLLSDEGSLSRGKGVVAAGHDLAAGTIMGQVATSGEYVPYLDTATDGSEVAAAILYAPIDTTGGVALPAVLIERLAEFDRNWVVGLDAAAEIDLHSNHLIAR